MTYQWYPGHMAKAKRMMQEDMKLINVVIELVDARIPISSKNPDIDSLAKNKSRVILLNKSDMADQRYNKAWKEYFEGIGYFVAIVNSKSGSGVKQVQDVVNKACQEKIEKDRKRGILNRPVRAMIVGIPNVGKSTFINSFVGKATAKTGNKPGVTKGKQWIRINKNIELLDTPGILWPKFEDQSVGLRLAMIGSINDNIINTTDLAIELIIYFSKFYPDALTERFGITFSEPLTDFKSTIPALEQIAVKRGCLLKGGEADIDRAGFFLVDDFRNTRFGNITLEVPPILNKETVNKADLNKTEVNKADINKVEVYKIDVKEVDVSNVDVNKADINNAGNKEELQ